MTGVQTCALPICNRKSAICGLKIPSGQRSRSPSLTKRIAASGNEIVHRDAHGDACAHKMPSCFKREYCGTEGNAQSSPWGHVNFTKVIFRPIKPVKLTGSLFPKRYAKCYSLLHVDWGEFNSRRCRHQNILHCSVCFEAVARGLDDVFTNRLKCAHV